jgi:hypothetical protein
MTVVAAVPSPEGFALGADGRQFLTNPPRSTDCAQKIFPTPFVNGTGFAFACAGATAFGFASGNCMDFTGITQRVMSELPDDAYLDCPEDYFGRVARRIFCELPPDVGLGGQPEADVLFTGYLNGKPLWAHIRFPHDKAGFLPPIVKSLTCSPIGFKVLAGSNAILDDMLASQRIFQPSNLSDAAEMVRLYAQTCVDSNKTVPDCKNFGGHVHVASITPDGFSWEIAPLNERGQLP